jgi:hypothetical protein
MKTRIAVALLSLLVAGGCMDGWTEAVNVLDHAAWAACVAKAGPLCGSAPAPERCGADTEGNPSAPGEGPAALDPPGACPAYTGDDPCVRCVLASCCASARACFSEATCTCLEAKEWPAGHPCGAPDDAYGTFEGCLADHCEAACGGT